MAPGLSIQEALNQGFSTGMVTQHAFPVYISIASAGGQLIHVIFASNHLRRVFGLAAKSNTEVASEGHIAAHGGRAIFAAEVLTLVGSLELLRVSLLRVGGSRNTELVLASIPFAYTSLLALFNVLYHRSTVASRHISIILVSSWIVFFIRDVIPLATYTESPADPLYMLWQLFGVLTFTAVLLPLITPRRYIPFDPTDPLPPNPEQTASWLSLALFSFLDHTIWNAYRVPHLPLSDLPPLADSDRAKHLIRAAFPRLDPPPKRHMFYAVAAVFRREIITITFLLLCNITLGLMSPYGLKKLLEYLENGGEGASVKPWVWIASLFFAPFTNTLVSQQYQKVLARATVHLEAILTQLILHHALRVRLVAPPPPSTPDDPAPTTGAKSLIGRMNNLISADLQAISRASEFMQVFLGGPLMVVLCIGFLYTILGWSALVGFAVLVAMTPLPVQVSKMLQGAAHEVSKKSDDRVESVTETMNVIRMVKMFGWEQKMAERIDEKRDRELEWVWWNKIYSLFTLFFHFIIPAVTMCVTFSVYALVMKRPLNAATVFSSIALFDILRSRIHTFSMWLPMVIKGNVSLQRVSDFLRNTELLDEFSETSQEDRLIDPDGNDDRIGFRAATFSWTNDDSDGDDSSGVVTPSSSTGRRRKFQLQIDEELLFKRGAINLIVGPTGSGKTSLLMALLGEMHFVPSGQGAWFNLPRSGGVAYAAQESWVMNTTIRDNIVFGAPFDEARYMKVIHQCALTRDLEVLSAGDFTEVGEKGLTLSGGQKARVTLARAIYSAAEVLLLDDILATLDVHTAKWIVDKCLNGDLVRGRTVLLVTHNINLVSPISDFVVSLGLDGRVVSRGSIQEVRARDSRVEAELVREEELEEKVEVEEEEGNAPGEVKARKDEGKLVVEEESGKGHLSWSSFQMYLFALGGRHWVFFWTVVTVTTVVECVLDVLQPWILGAWATEYSRHPPEEVNVSFYLFGYIVLMCLMLVIYFISQAALTRGALRASASLHRELIETILGTTLRWLDKTPTSRIVTRVTQDVAAVDTVIPDLFGHMFELAFTIAVRLIAILVYTPTVGLFAFVIFVAGGVVGNVYIKSQMSVKREMSKAKAPVVAHFGATVDGIVSIRAYGAQSSVLRKSLTLVDEYSRASRVFNNLARWIAVRVDALGGLFASLLGVYYVYYNSGVSPSNSAFTLMLAVGFGRMVLGFVQFLNMFEVNGNSLERLQEYMVIEREPKPHAGGVPPAHWPSSGTLRVEKLRARYTLDGPDVLHDLSFDVKAGERIGIVGRTGSGKSTLTLALLRCIFTEGDVYYDGMRTGDINLDALREKVTIIPQVPELLSGTLRRNLDPFDQFDDAILNAALRDAGLFSLQSGDGVGDVTLDSSIARGGHNLSVGQRQIIALARAMVRESKLLILDEATSAIDYQTDAIIQTSLRTQLSKDVTVITVAHRLQTVMDADRIMVLDAGKIVEFDVPHELLEKDGGLFRALVDESTERDALYAIAAQARHCD